MQPEFPFKAFGKSVNGNLCGEIRLHYLEKKVPGQKIITVYNSSIVFRVLMNGF